MKTQIIKRIAKSGNEEIRISRLSYRETEYVDLRIFFKLTENEMLPTRKGLVISKELLQEVIKGLSEAWKMQPSERVVIYSRCSTDEKRQDTDVQLKELRRYAEAYGWNYDEVSEYGSGFKDEQPKLNEIIEKIRLGYYRTLLVHSLDRFSRQHPKKTNALLDRIVYNYHCRFLSLKEGIDSENEMVWCAIRPMFSYFANVFSKQLSEKIKAGIRNKKEKGIFRGGRPSKQVDLNRLQAILEGKGRLPLRKLTVFYNEGLSRNQQIGYTTLRKAVNSMSVKLSPKAPA